ncbi:MAG: NAD(P)-dependent glycerol-3-phosphate dehydrogenase [Gemmataceae bacterium]|nr:NAD(P)-dependent glycerol-3-phosphate dehydrogenase [Gemmataceae bacterium]
MRRFRFAVLGSGGWGTAMAVHLAKLGHPVTLWAARPEWAAELAETRENARLLPGVRIPDTVAIEHDPVRAVADADLWAIAIPTAFLRKALTPFPSLCTDSVRLLSLAKGIENGTFLRPTQIFEELFGPRTTGVLSGPSHAEEMARGLPTSVVAASRDPDFALEIQAAFGSDRFRVYTNRDVVGVELAGALKNVLGIAAGICDGLGFGDNAKAALLARGLVEMTRFGVAAGADAATFVGLAGAGDLIATCFSRHGRNRRVGERLGKGESLADILAGPMVAEGVWTARSVAEWAKARGIETPIMTAVHQVLHEGKPPLAAVRDLMTRHVGEESEC